MTIPNSLPPAVAFDGEKALLRIIDQTLLPGCLSQTELYTMAQVRQAIQRLQVRGAPAIGIAAAYGLYLAMKDSHAANKPEFLDELALHLEYLAAARPTAVNLRWALERLHNAAEAFPAGSIPQLKQALLAEAQAIEAEERAAGKGIGQLGLSLIKEGDSLLTHCNTGQLATVGYGTALAPIYLALEQGMGLKIYCDETRPLLQGARLTAFELSRAGADITLLCDNMAASLMAAGAISSVWVGADRIAQNGDTANKIGTLGLAVLAHHYGIPFYVCAPSSTIDPATTHGQQIKIEQRPAAEVSELWYEKPMAPADIEVYNPAFDITPGHLISGIITEEQIFKTPYFFKKK